MRHIRTRLSLFVAALLVSACGGGDPYVPGSGSPSGAPTTPGSFTSVVSFGDSLSDAGAYTPATSVNGDGMPPYLGGKLTTNISTDQQRIGTGPIWVENVAKRYSLPGDWVRDHAGRSRLRRPVVQVPGCSESGVGRRPAPPMARPARAVTDSERCAPYRPGHRRAACPDGAGQDADRQPPGAIRSFKPSDLVLVWAGGNELFGKWKRIRGSIRTAMSSDWRRSRRRRPAGADHLDQAKRLAFQAQIDSQEAMKIAALELAGLHPRRDPGQGREVRGGAAPARPGEDARRGGSDGPVARDRLTLTTFCRDLQLWLREGLTGQPVTVDRRQGHLRRHPRRTRLATASST